ncbi:MAG: hypothetical protein ABI832_18080 [bacterium]
MVVKNGTPDPDTLAGSTGDDTLRGRGGDDMLFGGDGNDLIFGGAGHDTVDAGPGTDLIYGDDGDDRLIFSDLSGGEAHGGKGLDTLDLIITSGPGIYLDFRDGSATQSAISPGSLSFSGIERLVVTSSADGDTIFGSAAND